ncbi:MAG: hypothetical protein HGA42_13475 [Nostocales cyanobacterium W4_Combined_metabat2_030]|nr:hypothetical protein [Nostocales cyanobacterium W4_Combined_metabat2_030]
MESLKYLVNTANLFLFFLSGYNAIDVTRKVVDGFFSISDASSFFQLVLLILGVVMMVVKVQHSYSNWKLDRQIKAENLKKLVNQNKEFNLNVEIADRIMDGVKKDELKNKK